MERPCDILDPPPRLTDIVDLVFNAPLEKPAAAAAELKTVVGVVEHGLFCGMADEVLVAGKGGVHYMHKSM